MLLAAYPVLALAGANTAGNVRAHELMLPIGVAVLTVGSSWVATRWLTRDRDKRALIAAYVAGGLALYGPLTQGVNRLSRTAPPGTTFMLLAVLVTLVAGITSATDRTIHLHRNLSGVTTYLNVATAVLVALPLVSLLRASHSAGRAAQFRDAAVSTVTRRGRADADAAGLPDIYYIVLDSYSSGASLASVYGYDNGPYEAALRARGFVLPSNSRSNYVITFLALAAALNGQYLHHLPVELGADARSRVIPHTMIEESRLIALLKSRGYRLVFFPTSYNATAYNRHADVLFDRRGSTEFEAVWFESTPFFALTRAACAFRGSCANSVFPFAPEGAEAVRWKFARLAGVPQLPGPTVTFAHLMVPHEPFIFNADCSTRDLYWPSGPVEDAKWRRAYAAQVACVNRLVLALVDALKARSRTPPVIVLQADHGHGRFPLGRAPALANTTPEQVHDRTHVFAAYHLPGGGAAQLYDSISPVNVLPLVLRHYLGVNVPRVADETYWSASTRPYDFTRVP